MQPGGAQHGKKAIGLCNAGQRRHGLAAADPVRQRMLLPVCTKCRIRQRALCLKSGLPGGNEGRVVFRHGLWRCRDLQQHGGAARPGLAQRAGGQQPAVANAAFIHDTNFARAWQSQVLQAIITYQQLRIRVLMQQLPGSLQALGAHHHGHTRVAVNQQWFIARVLGGSGRCDG